MRKHKIAPPGEVALEEIVDFTYDRVVLVVVLMMIMMTEVLR
jgi:hypothetical protein